MSPKQAVRPRVKLMRPSKCEGPIRSATIPACGWAIDDDEPKPNTFRGVSCACTSPAARNASAKTNFFILALRETLRTIRGHETKWPHLQLGRQPARSTKRI
jgi:hypothetical protein